MGLLINHYSFIWVSVPLVLLVGFIVLRRRPGFRDFVAVFAIAAGFLIAWLFIHPVQSEDVYDAMDIQRLRESGKPLLLEFQSPYCIICIDMRPVVDRMEAEFKDRINVVRINIQDNPGVSIAPDYGVFYTPTFIMFDAKGNELWRHTGEVDPQLVRDTLKSMK